MSFFDEVETTVANTRLLQAVEDSGPIELKYAPIESLVDLQNKLTREMRCIDTLTRSTIANYLFKQYLLTTLDNSDAVSLMNLLEDYRKSYPSDRRHRAIKLFETHTLIHPPHTDHLLVPIQPQSPSPPSSSQPNTCNNNTANNNEHSKNSNSSNSNDNTTATPPNNANHNTVNNNHTTTAAAADNTDNTSYKATDYLTASHSIDYSSISISSLSKDNPINNNNNNNNNNNTNNTETPPNPATGPLIRTMVSSSYSSSAVVTPSTTTTTTTTTSSKNNNASTTTTNNNNTNNNNTTNNSNANESWNVDGTISPLHHKCCSALLSTTALTQVHQRIATTPLNEPLPADLFDPLRTQLAETLTPFFNQWISSPFFHKYVQLTDYASRGVKLSDFRVFRVLGRGAFGAVSCVQKLDTHAIFAMKEMSKKQVKFSQSEWMVMNEKKVLAKMKSPFVLNLKYSFHNEESFYLIFDMCAGGDLKYHLREVGGDKCFPLERAKFYAAEVLLGLEFLHSLDIVYRDLKPNNILLDISGHVKISDLGLTIKLRKNKVLKHLAGTAGYWAPEIVMKTGTYKSSDWWSFGTFLYEMLAGKRPNCTCAKKSMEWCPFGQKRIMEENALKEEGVLKLDVQYPPDKFTKEARDLCEKLFVVDPKTRLGANGTDEIKNHPFFADIDWEKLSALEVVPPFIPDQRTVYADSIGGVGDMPKGKFKKVKIEAADEAMYQGFTFTSEEGVQCELVEALKKIEGPNKDANSNTIDNSNADGGGACCTIV